MKINTVSFEFFPPKTAKGNANLVKVAKKLSQFNPEFFSVTFGAGGSTRVKTAETVQAIRHATNVDTAPHISTIGSNTNDILSLLYDYHQQGISHLVVLRGDAPQHQNQSNGEFHYANELVTFIQSTMPNTFTIEVAGYPEMHPEAINFITDITYLKQKVDAGANGIITQYFYNLDAYCYFVDACRESGITVPITPGIMPITNLDNLIRFSNHCGAEIPTWLLQQLQAYGNDKQAVIDFSIDVVSKLCEKLLIAGAPSLHFYTLNKLIATEDICRNIFS